jgi:hypothetical protein
MSSVNLRDAVNFECSVVIIPQYAALIVYSKSYRYPVLLLVNRVVLGFSSYARTTARAAYKGSHGHALSRGTACHEAKSSPVLEGTTPPQPAPVWNQVLLPHLEAL